MRTIDATDLAAGLAELEALAAPEFGLGFGEIMADRQPVPAQVVDAWRGQPGGDGLDVAARLLDGDAAGVPLVLLERVGRLLGVYVKRPFCAHPVKRPESPYEFHGARLKWHVVVGTDGASPVDVETCASRTTDPIYAARWRLLEATARTAGKPVLLLGESDVLRHILRAVRPVVCGGPTAEVVGAAADEATAAGAPVAVLTPERLLAAGATTIATWLVSRLPALQPHLPIVTGLTIMLLAAGKAGVCRYIALVEARSGGRQPQPGSPEAVAALE